MSTRTFHIDRVVGQEVTVRIMRVRKRLMACATVVFAILCTLLSQTPALAATGAHKAMHGGTITLTDSIAYTGATVGQEYELVGTLHTKNAAGSDAGVLKDADGQEVTKSAKFVPTETAGTATVDIDVDTMNLDVGTSIVASD